MTNSWQERRSASFRLQPIQLHQLEAAFLAAGIGPGMRVLDIGSGVGDVAFLAADLVGRKDRLWELIAIRPGVRISAS
jgi:cyclopropane fatty-acyl-phospholipid synthase-like methyltransferase